MIAKTKAIKQSFRLYNTIFNVIFPSSNDHSVFPKNPMVYTSKYINSSSNPDNLVPPRNRFFQLVRLMK